MAVTPSLYPVKPAASPPLAPHKTLSNCRPQLAEKHSGSALDRLAPHAFWGVSFPSTVHAQAKRIRKMRSAMQNGFHMPGIPALNQ